MDVAARRLQWALLALHGALALAPESLAAALGRTPAPDAPPALQVCAFSVRMFAWTADAAS